MAAEGESRCLHADHLAQTAGVRRRCRATIPECIFVEVAEAADALPAPASDALGPRRQLLILEVRPVLAAVESEISPVGGQLHVEWNSPTDGQAQGRVGLS